MSNYSEVRYATPEYPRQLRLDTTTSCNAKCLSCHRYQSTRNGRLTVLEITDILKDVATWPVPLNEIIPVNYGEFFTLPYWDTILDMIAKKLPKTQIVLPTNGSLIETEAVDRLCKIPTLKIINFSVNAFFDETYEAFMGLPATNIGNIIKSVARIKIQRPDIKVWASMVFDPAYQSDYEKDRWLQLWQMLSDQAWVLSASSANRPGKQTIIHHKIPCRSLFSDIVIGYDSKLSSCCFDPNFELACGYYTGDLKKDWHNPELEALRKAHNDHERSRYKLCQNCTSA